MCSICEGTEVIKRSVDISERSNLETSVRYDSEQSNWLMLRVQIGSFGYTLPIQANYCFHCGRNLKEEKDCDKVSDTDD
jgi:hypothetical protein